MGLMGNMFGGFVTGIIVFWGVYWVPLFRETPY